MAHLVRRLTALGEAKKVFPGRELLGKIPSVLDSMAALLPPGLDPVFPRDPYPRIPAIPLGAQHPQLT